MRAGGRPRLPLELHALELKTRDHLDQERTGFRRADQRRDQDLLAIMVRSLISWLSIAKSRDPGTRDHGTHNQSNYNQGASTMSARTIALSNLQDCHPAR